MHSWTKLTKLDKVDMFSKEAIKKQSWQSWCIFVFNIAYIMESKVGKVEICFFLIMGKIQGLGKVGDTYRSIWLLY